MCVQIGRSVALGEILAGPAARSKLAAILEDPEILIVCHEAAYDALATIATWPDLLPLWLAAYDADRVTCTGIREKLIRVAEGTLLSYAGRLGLDALCDTYRIPKPWADETYSWRSRFHELDGRDPATYPPEARNYALGDLVAVDVYKAQERAHPAPWLADQFRRARGQFWLALTSAHGMRVSPEAVAHFAGRVEREHAIARELLGQGTPASLAAFVEAWNRDHPDGKALPEALKAPWQPLVRSTGSKAMKAARERMIAVCAADGIPLPLTKKAKELLAKGETFDPKDYVALDADACNVSRDPLLIAYARYTSIGTLRGRAERLRMAAEMGLPMQPRFDVLKETGRTSSSSGGKKKPGQEIMAFGDQSQNLPRSPGLRECYIARPGCVIVSVDWKSAELNTLAQTCLDLGLDSQLARVLNSGADVHLWYACQVRGWDYTWAKEALKGKHGPEAQKQVKEGRQGAKACNFGFPGGLGIEKFRLFARKQYQVDFTEQEARERKGIWLAAFYEMGGYFQHIDALIQSGRPLVHPGSNRYRGRIRYTSAANSYFQGRCADMLIDAGWRIAKEIHAAGLPARLWNEAHDEILLECPASEGDRVARRAVEIMEAVGLAWCPGAPVKAEPAIQRTWRKGAEPAYAGDTLIPWEDRELNDLEREKVKKTLASTGDLLYTSWVVGIEPARVREITA